MKLAVVKRLRDAFKTLAAHPRLDRVMHPFDKELISTIGECTVGDNAFDEVGILGELMLDEFRWCRATKVEAHQTRHMVGAVGIAFGVDVVVSPDEVAVV